MKKWLTGTVGTAVVVTVFATAISENLINPLLGRAVNFLVSISTLGVASFQNGIYRDIAEGMHEEASLRAMMFLYSAMIGFLAATLVLYVLTRIYKTPEDLRGSNFFSRIGSIMHSKIFIALYFTIVIVSFSLDFSRVIYVNQAVTYYDQLKTVTRPYMTDQESMMFDSEFAQITNSNDYVQVTSQLVAIAKSNKLRIPVAPTLIGTIQYPGF